MKRIVVRRVSLAMTLLLGTFAYALYLDEKSLDEKVRDSKVVLVGTVREIQGPTEALNAESVIVRVERILKGSAAKSIRVVTKSGVAEENAFCRAGRRYIFFLGKHADIYYSVNGQFGIVPADGGPDDLPERAPHPQR